MVYVCGVRVRVYVMWVRVCDACVYVCVRVCVCVMFVCCVLRALCVYNSLIFTKRSVLSQSVQLNSRIASQQFPPSI